MMAVMADDEITIVLADDHAVVRSGLRMLLDAEDGLRVVAEAGTVDDAVRLTKAHRPADPRPGPQHAGRDRASSLDALPALPRGARHTRGDPDDAGEPGVRAHRATAPGPRPTC